jgi:glycosyltransferase involved in cell wall biosynthesis
MSASTVSAIPPLVSVIVPTFDRLQYLPAAIESVLNQRYQNWELLVSDDGSVEPTRQYLQSLARNPRIAVIWSDHSGIPALVRNRALHRARGEYVAFLDSDDLWDERKLELQIELLSARPRCGWSYTAFANVDENGIALQSEARRRFSPCDGPIFERILRGEVSIRTPSVLAERRLLLECGGFDISMRSAEDYDLWLRMALRSEIALVNQPLVRVRHHEQNHSADWSSAYVGQDHTFLKLQAGADPAQRAALKRARARNASRLAAQHAAHRNRIHALRALAGSAAFSWRYAEWWGQASKVLLRAFLPAWALAGYRRAGDEAA